LRLSQTAASRGDRVELAGSGFGPATEVDVTLHSNPIGLGRVTTDSSGSFTLAITVPQAAAVGSHNVVATGVDANGASLVLSAPFEVRGAAASTRGSSGPVGLPRTGTSSAAMVAGALLLIVIGAGFVVGARQRGTALSA
jgi:titin